MIQIENVTKTYNNSVRAVDQLNLTVNNGEIVGFIGPNGAGKTTTLKMLTGILKPDSGSIRIDGFDMLKEPLKAKQVIGYIADSPDMFLRLKGIEFLNLISDIYKVPTSARQERIKSFATRFDLADVLDEPMQNYSHGMRQKIMVAAALVHDPEVWILDEPLTGLDPKSAYTLKTMMREHADAGNSVLFSTHVLEVAEKLCDKVIIINHGRTLFYGTLEELVSQYPDMDLEKIFLAMTAHEYLFNTYQNIYRFDQHEPAAGQAKKDHAHNPVFFCCLLYTAAGRIRRWHLSKINDRNLTADRLCLPWYSAYVPCDLSIHRDLWHQCNL